ncbi:hypothetical protein IHQ71_11650 [Rhizobium sp. TH2]|uniref:hypothetical protein n=1 Tax=Rhizobium sp. TH2 TaxID=2775403 RepID=UPI0021583E1F|nr:hypothetical protein [Rhizobium sp. TH2]UVC11166.1 hypothetical protein IHQ71_11650 [Rhizobium sp. TH2]
MTAIVNEGRTAGWSNAYITATLIVLFYDFTRANAAVGETERQIAEAIERLRDG